MIPHYRATSEPLRGRTWTTLCPVCDVIGGNFPDKTTAQVAWGEHLNRKHRKDDK